MIPKERLLKKLETPDGTILFDEWYDRLKDKKSRAVIASRLLRIKSGNFGDVKPLASARSQLRLRVGKIVKIGEIE